MSDNAIDGGQPSSSGEGSARGGLEGVLAQFRELSRDERGKGRMFEKMIAGYLRVDPQYAELLDDVWLWDEWPDRPDGVDLGIDLVARERASGDYWAVQCKFFGPDQAIDKPAIDSFLSESGKTYRDGAIRFSRRFVVSTTDKWNRNAEKAIEGQAIPVTRIGIGDLADSPVDWDRFSLDDPGELSLRGKKELRRHQEEAVADVLEGFKASDRGQLIMACGTGKTLVSLRLAERLLARPGPGEGGGNSPCPQGFGRVLFLAPSISLVAQSLREWTAEALNPIDALVVCSDTKVGRDEEDIRLHDLAYPATTDAAKLAAAAAKLDGDRPLVVFSTYQSIQVVADAQEAGLGEFDLVVCDEAHRTTGAKLANEDPSEFVKVHDNGILRAARRLYMTATPRVYADASRKKAGERDAVLFSMDGDEFGPEFHRIGFGQAVQQDLLADYKVLIVAVDQDRMGAAANRHNVVHRLEGGKGIDTDFATKILGSWKGLSKRGLVLVNEEGKEEELTDDAAPMRRAVAFSRTIAASKTISQTFPALTETFGKGAPAEELAGMVSCEIDHVDGGMNALRRAERLRWLEGDPGEGGCRILSNARCLSEGIDVPALDAVVFFDTRESIVDIVQSVGRVMRKTVGKKYGYVILPVCIPSKEIPDFNAYIDRDPQFRKIWKVIKALRAHDESLVDEGTFRDKIQVLADPGGPGESGDGGVEGALQLALPLGALSEAVYAAIPKKLGDREYWAHWAKDAGTAAERLIARIKDMVGSAPAVGKEFERFLKGLKDTLNPAVTQDEAVEMLAQHVLTMPVFQALFAETDFPQSNAVGRALQRIVAKLDVAAVASETEGLERFYEDVRRRIGYAKSDKSKQEVIRNLYDTFFHNAFPRMAERLGMVYTPVPVVDFILKSADATLRKHFGTKLASNDVHILDPFVGTGTFLVRLIQLGLLDEEALRAKFGGEIHGNEIVLLAYYVATVNVEIAYHEATGDYRTFGGMVLTDTFQMTEKGDLVDQVVLPDNNERAERQLAESIKVIIGNPPYSAKQKSENDNNKNLIYPSLDDSIRKTYAARSSAGTVGNVYDSYIRAIRWASARIEDRGVVAFVTSGSYIDGNNADGVRKCLTEEFSHLYVFNLRGNQRTSGETSRKEGGKVFGGGSRAPVAITIMVKDPNHVDNCELRYHDIGDYLDREEKLQIIDGFSDIEGLPWRIIQPNAEGDWINQRDSAFDEFIPLGADKGPGARAIFETYSLGVVTNRDAWAYNSSRSAVESNMRQMVDAYNVERKRYADVCAGMAKADRPAIETVIDANPKRIKWTRSLKADAFHDKAHEFNASSIRQGMYRPFAKQWLYFDRRLIETVYLQPKLFPTPFHENVVIASTGKGAITEFSAFAASAVPDLSMVAVGQCFPLNWYAQLEDLKDQHQAELFVCDAEPDEGGYIRRDGVSDWALAEFRQHYRDDALSKENIFWYVYGILHSPEYKSRFAADLKKLMPRIPLAADFRAFSDAGRALGELHLGYERVEPWPLEEEASQLALVEDSPVVKMAFGKAADGSKDKSVIVYNADLTLRGIPSEAYDYVVNGKSAVEWVMDRYQVRTDRDSGIVNDPNDWSEDPRYIVDLLKRVVRVSVESARIVKALPALEEHCDKARDA